MKKSTVWLVLEYFTVVSRGHWNTCCYNKRWNEFLVKNCFFEFILKLTTPTYSGYANSHLSCFWYRVYDGVKTIPKKADLYNKVSKFDVKKQTEEVPTKVGYVWRREVITGVYWTVLLGCQPLTDWDTACGTLFGYLNYWLFMCFLTVCSLRRGVWQSGGRFLILTLIWKDKNLSDSLDTSMKHFIFIRSITWSY